MIHNYVLFRQICALLFLLDALFFLPYLNLWLGSGFDSSRWVKKPYPLVLLLFWIGSAASLFLGWQTWIASAVLYAIFRFYFIKARWRSLLRGAGAVGFMPHWIMFYILLFESAFRLQDRGILVSDLSRLMQVDFSFVFICAGTYKIFSGYLKGEGLQYALANPIWSYFFSFFRKTDPNHWLYQIINFSAPLGQLMIGALLFFKETQALGAAALMAGFLAITLFFRIGRLGPQVASIGLLFFPEFHLHWFSLGTPLTKLAVPGYAIRFLHLGIWTVVFLIPAVKVIQYTNLIFNKSLPVPLQKFVNSYANFFPIIIWRVFTADITNFFVRIIHSNHSNSADSANLGELKEQAIVDETGIYSPFSWKNPWLKYRYLHVGESIAIATLFNTLKTFSSNPDLFYAKLRQYTETLPATMKSEKVTYRYMLISKSESELMYVPVIEYVVEAGRVIERPLVANHGAATKAKYSPIRESEGYGSYVKKS